MALPPLFGFEVKSRAIQTACEEIYGKNCQEGSPYRTAFLLVTERQIGSILCNRTAGALHCEVSTSTKVVVPETDSSTGGGVLAAKLGGGLLLVAGAATVQPEVVVAGLAVFMAACPKSETIEAPKTDAFNVDDVFRFEVPTSPDTSEPDMPEAQVGDDGAITVASDAPLPEAPSLADSGADTSLQTDTPPQADAPAPDAPSADTPPQPDTPALDAPSADTPPQQFDTAPLDTEQAADTLPDQGTQPPDVPVVVGDTAAAIDSTTPEDAVVLKELPNYGQPDGKDDGWVSQFEGGAVLCFNTTASTCTGPKSQCWSVAAINGVSNPDLLAFIDPDMEYLDVTLDGGPYDKVEEGVFTLVDFGEALEDGFYEFATWMSEDTLIIAKNISSTVALSITKGGKNEDFSSCDWNFDFPCMEEGGNPCE